jgi:alpha-beta hydrolase superfamily lysophospholipase
VDTVLQFLSSVPTFVWIILGVLAGSGILMYPITLIVASNWVYNATLRRTSPEKWGRVPSAPEDPESMEMDAMGMAWAEAHRDAMKEVHVVRDGDNLYGEYYDFGHKRAVMILSGRTESLRYGYYFAIPYAKAGWNILVVDPRAHGKSDGEFNTVGFEESLDDIVWVKHLRDCHGVEQVVFHGICIGAAGGILALTNPDCPDVVKGLVTEGMFPNFGESMKNHLIERKKTMWGLYPLIRGCMRRHTGHSMDYGPIDVISRLEVPLLMLHSREDRYSTPEYAQKLYDLAGTPDKRLVWFERGRHSMLRITDTALYDRSVTDFVNQLDESLISH